MSKDTTFIRDDVFPSYWPNDVGEYISTLATNFKITKVDNTTIEVVAGTGDNQVCIGIKGLMRWNTATVQVAHPGGSAGTYPIFVTTTDNDIDNTPDPYTDSTNHSFALKIAAIGGTPTIIPGTVDQYRQVGTLEWNGSAITRIDQTVSAEPYSPTVDEKAALAGTNGTPSSSNKYLTDSDPRNTNERTPSDGSVTNVKVSSSAAIARSKLAEADSAIVYRSTYITFTDNSSINLVWEGQERDTTDMWSDSDSTEAQRLYAKKTGWHIAYLNLNAWTIVGTAGPVKQGTIYHYSPPSTLMEGVTNNVAGKTPNASVTFGSSVFVKGLFYMTAGDFVRALASLYGAGNNSCQLGLAYFKLVYLGP